MFADTAVPLDHDSSNMAGFPSPFGGADGGSSGGDLFDDEDAFVPDHIPEPGPFVADQDILTGDEHVAFHLLTKDFFEERGVYDMTFGYNLARLNADTRHPRAGYRYAVERTDGGDDESSVLRAEFTPTTPFCPQSDTLTKGSFRAWNGLSDRHEYDIVRVRVSDMHHASDDINDTLEELEETFRETGTVTALTSDSRTGSPSGRKSGGKGCSDGSGTTSRGYGPDAPF
jgi:hypothetical protein